MPSIMVGTENKQEDSGPIPSNIHNIAKDTYKY